MKKINLSVVASLLVASTVVASEVILDEVVVTSTPFTQTEKTSSKSVEIYTKTDIEKSNSSTLYDFLNEQTSLNTLPNSGNIFSQKFDLRGYGITNGYENIVIVVDGRRLNNIDGAPQILSSIPISSIESIEILKGSGSALYGDGAMAGVLNIKTDGKYQSKLKFLVGNRGTIGKSLQFGYSFDKLVINSMIDFYNTDGNRKINNSGNSDKKSNKNLLFSAKYFLKDNLELRFLRSSNDIDMIYANSMTKAQFDENPNDSVTGSTHQTLESDLSSFGLTYDLNSNNSIDIDYNDESKTSVFLPTFKSDYETKEIKSVYKLSIKNTKIALGVSKQDAFRKGSDNKTSKNSKAIFASITHQIDSATSLNIEARDEKVEYIYHKDDGSKYLEDNHHLQAYEIGINRVLNPNQSIFINYNKAYQAPNIDRFFNWGGTFNSFIKPAISKTFNIGFNDFRETNKFKATLFKTNLTNEIYYYSTGPWSGRNTNIDKSHKYGLEIYDKYKINETYYTSINYSYIIAKIDDENDGGGTYNSKYLPGVSKHNLTLNFGATYDKTTAILSHTYKSSTYSSEDFSNTASQKQKAYNSTNLSLNYQANKKFNVFAKVTNILDKKNGMWVRDDNIYPINFERAFYVGIDAKF